MNKTALIIVGILNYLILAAVGYILIPKGITFYHVATMSWYILSSILCSNIIVSAIMEEKRMKLEEELFGFGVNFGGKYD